MKKILMLITAFLVCSEILPTASAQEVSTLSNPQGATAVEQNARFITSIKADSTFVNRCLRDMITILETNREIYNRRVDSLIALQEYLRAAATDDRFESKIEKWAGRNRYGKYTEQCAAHANGCLARAGYYAQGHAYQVVGYFPSVINGYTNVEIPNLADMSYGERFAAVLNMHIEAADYVKAHLDISKLATEKYYLVNMYYNTSPYMLQFFYAAHKEGTRNYGTHVGVLYYSAEHETWIVEHNIHGDVYYDALETILGGASNPHKYGVTSISQVTKR
jgi:hypothetical protein